MALASSSCLLTIFPARQPPRGPVDLQSMMLEESGESASFHSLPAVRSGRPGLGSPLPRVWCPSSASWGTRSPRIRPHMTLRLGVAHDAFQAPLAWGPLGPPAEVSPPRLASLTAARLVSNTKAKEAWERAFTPAGLCDMQI